MIFLNLMETWKKKKRMVIRRMNLQKIPMLTGFLMGKSIRDFMRKYITFFLVRYICLMLGDIGGTPHKFKS